jgi:hypothetical protein
MTDITIVEVIFNLISPPKESIVNAAEKVNCSVQVPLSSVGIDSFAALDESGLQISPSERLHRLAVQEVRKLAISLMFPLLEKFNMPIKLV